MQSAVEVEWGLRVPLRDGVRLHGTLYRSTSGGPAGPVIVTLTPYTSQLFHDHGLYFARHGLSYLAVDTRGRGNSEGHFRPLIQEANDGYDIIEWTAAQPFCNGKVAMWGGSYGGYAQWATARKRPAHLTSIVPVAAADIAVDFPIRNNIASPYVMQWLTLVAGRTLQDRIFWNNERFWRGRYCRWFQSGKSFRSLDTALGMGSSVFQEWVSQPRQGEYWDDYNLTAEEYAALALPILTITGIYDADQPGALSHYRRHLRSAAASANHYLIIGPWDHAGTRIPERVFSGFDAGAASLIDMGQLHVQWYAWTLQGGPKPEFLKDRVAYYVVGANRWQYAPNLESATERVTPLYLDSQGDATRVFSSGTLGANVGVGAPDTYVHDPRDVSAAELEADSSAPLSLRPTFPIDDVTDQTHVFAQDGRHLVYHGSVFREERYLCGFFRLEAWISIDQPDTDIRASVYAVDGAGRSLLLSSDCVRARYRTGLRSEALIRTTGPLKYTFEAFTFAAHRMAPGARLRLVIGPVHSIYYEKNYNAGGVVADETVEDARTVTVRVFHDGNHPSALWVPEGSSDQSAYA